MKENEIQPSSELESHLSKMCHAEEAEAFMQSNRSGIVGVDARDHDVLAKSCGPLEERHHEGGSNAPAPAIGTNMDAVLHCKSVTRPRAEVTE